MGRGVSSGEGQSSLGYLFGTLGVVLSCTIMGKLDRPSTKVHAAPGGGSSLGYLFGGGSN